MNPLTPFQRPESPVLRHYRQVHLHGYLEWEGRVRGKPLRLQRVHAANGRVALFTDGVSAFYTARPQEFLLYSAAPSRWHHELLLWLAEAADAGEWLDWGQLHPLPPALRREQHAALLLSPPFLEPPALETLHDDGHPVRLLMVTPVNDDAARLAQRAGAAALETALARGGSNFSAD